MRVQEETRAELWTVDPSGLRSNSAPVYASCLLHLTCMPGALLLFGFQNRSPSQVDRSVWCCMQYA